jgi:N-acetylmuramic acid 6-phosphate (MurNAc-6-P) etherase
VHGPALETKLIKTGKPWANYMINLFPQRKKDMKERKIEIDENCGCEMHRAAKLKKMQHATCNRPRQKKMHSECKYK